jgi:hypothetical protein
MITVVDATGDLVVVSYGTTITMVYCHAHVVTGIGTIVLHIIRMIVMWHVAP